MYFHYWPANKVAGYSGWVIYYSGSKTSDVCVWMVPGTFFYDWDNQ